MKKGIFCILTVAMLLSGCSSATTLPNKKETPVATNEDEKNMTENDLDVNEFLVHNVILSYTGFQTYEIKKTNKDESVLIVKDDDGNKTTVTVKAYDNDKNVKLTKRVLKAKDDETDKNGYVYYSLSENDMKYIVYLQSATVEIKCVGNRDILTQLTCRKSNLSCC